MNCEGGWLGDPCTDETVRCSWYVKCVNGVFITCASTGGVCNTDDKCCEVEDKCINNRCVGCIGQNKRCHLGDTCCSPYSCFYGRCA